jgi:Mn2+/Fe2+ NRAMP family transporter
MLEFFDTRWRSDRWKVWILGGGILAVPCAILLAAIAALISGERLVPLILLMLIAIVLAGSLVGSGVIDTLSGRMNRGGLARESTEDIDRALSTREVARAEEHANARRDRRTIGAGIFIVPSLVAFLFFMTIV